LSTFSLKSSGHPGGLVDAKPHVSIFEDCLLKNHSRLSKRAIYLVLG